MRIKIADLITSLNGLKDNSYSDAQILEWLNEVESQIKAEVIKSYERQTITVTSDTLEYDLTTGYNQMDVIDIYIDKELIDKNDLRDMYNAYITDNTSFSDAETNNSKLVFQEGIDADVIITYQQKHTPYTATTSYLLVEPPYSKLYTEYISAKIDYFDKEYTAYNNGIQIYNQTLENFRGWYNKRKPTSPVKTIKNVYGGW